LLQNRVIGDLFGLQREEITPRKRRSVDLDFNGIEPFPDQAGKVWPIPGRAFLVNRFVNEAAFSARWQQ